MNDLSSSWEIGFANRSSSRILKLYLKPESVVRYPSGMISINCVCETRRTFFGLLAGKSIVKRGLTVLDHLKMLFFLNSNRGNSFPELLASIAKTTIVTLTLLLIKLAASMIS